MDICSLVKLSIFKNTFSLRAKRKVQCEKQVKTRVKTGQKTIEKISDRKGQIQLNKT